MVSCLLRNPLTSIYVSLYNIELLPEQYSVIHIQIARDSTWNDLHDVIANANRVSLKTHPCGTLSSCSSRLEKLPVTLKFLSAREYCMKLVDALLEPVSYSFICHASK